MASFEIWEASPLFEAVQRSGIFPDGKTFVDCVPHRPLAEIVADYVRHTRDGNGLTGGAVDLRRFVTENFALPRSWSVVASTRTDIVEYIHHLWQQLRRPADNVVAGSTLLPLPHPYVVPGGRFREIYYWDSYFTMLGLRESGDDGMIEHMLHNFSALIARHGFIPNGNRSYYLGRSQAPYFALMVELAAERRPDALLDYREALQAEYDYWMDRTAPTRHVVTLLGIGTLNRYYDQGDTPRPESFVEDEALAARSTEDRPALFRDVRSAAESGWDFSSRWLVESRKLETIETTNILPVDLNGLLHRLETVLARAHELAGDREAAMNARHAAAARGDIIRRHLWSGADAFFVDRNLRTGRLSDRVTLAGVVPLFLEIATPPQAERVAETLERHLLKPGGLVTTLIDSGQQWDAPNGWAPLQWMTIRGLERYGHHELAAEIARRWIKLNCDTFARRGQLMEKYNVVDPEVDAAGGEYISQHGFGWTNGVLLKLLREYPQEIQAML